MPSRPRASDLRAARQAKTQTAEFYSMRSALEPLKVALNQARERELKNGLEWLYYVVINSIFKLPVFNSIIHICRNYYKRDCIEFVVFSWFNKDGKIIQEGTYGDFSKQFAEEGIQF